MLSCHPSTQRALPALPALRAGSLGLAASLPSLPSLHCSVVGVHGSSLLAKAFLKKSKALATPNTTVNVHVIINPDEVGAP